MAITTRTLLILLVFASAAIMGLSAAKKNDICTEPIGSCQGMDCNKSCLEKHTGGSGTCDQSNTCICHFDCPPGPAPKKCNAGLGLCSSRCSDNCCAQNCASKYKDGVGYCDMLGYTWLCQCKYSC